MTSWLASLDLRAKNALRPLLDTVDPGRAGRAALHRWFNRRAYRGLDLRNAEYGNRKIKQSILSGDAFAAGKFGATESKLYSAWRTCPDMPDRVAESYKHDIYVQAGVFPVDGPMLRYFCEVYLQAAKQVDHLGVWHRKGEIELIRDASLAKRCNLFALTGLEPYYFSEPWSAALQGKTVLVISPFTETIGRQYALRSRLWDGDVLPEFDLRLLNFPLSKALAGNGFDSWKTILESYRSKMDMIEYDIVLTGAGAATLPLATHAKRMGKQGIGMGGALQCLFGIMGHRWEYDAFFKTHANEHWTRPSKSEVPAKAALVENGAYW